MNYLEDNNAGALILENDDHYLGTFDNVYEAMKRYPSGGLEGDYILIFGVKHFWNVNRQSWGSLKDREDNLVHMLENGLKKADSMITDMKLWVEDKVQEAIDEVANESKEYVDSMFRTSVKFQASGSVFKKGDTPTVVLKWSAYYQGKEVELDSAKVDGVEAVSPMEVKPVVDTEYLLTAVRGEDNITAKVHVVFCNPAYWGIVDDNFEVSAESIKNLSSGGILKADKGYSSTAVSLNNQRFCYAYPKSMGKLVSIVDGNGFEVSKAYTLSEITMDGEEYYVYLLSDPISGSDIKQIYC